MSLAEGSEMALVTLSAVAREKQIQNKPGGTVQKSTVYLGSEYLVLSFLTSLNHQLFKNMLYLCICVFVNFYLCICVSDSPEYHF